MAIKCGNCKNYHDSVAEVRECHNAPATLQQRATRLINFDSATDRQKNLIEQLLAERTPVSAGPTIIGPVMTKREASAVIDWLMASPKAGAVRDARVVPYPSTAKNVPLGTYTVVLNEDDNEYVTLRIDQSLWADGKTTVSFLSGADNDLSYTRFAFITDAGLKVWKKYRNESRFIAATQLLLTGNVDEAHERFLNIAEAYALRSGKCMRCNRTLTVPASLHRGLGPVCANVEGV